MVRRCLFLALAACLVMAAGCKKTYFGNAPVEPMVGLELAFSDPAWTGDKVPAGQQCRRYGGAKSASPAIVVSGIPAGADTIIVEFNDKSYAPLSMSGGHGAISVPVPAGATSLTVPSVRGETFDLPAGVSRVAAHRATASGIGKGVYLPPCSGGRGNLYKALVHAVRSSDKAVLAQGEISLGRY